ncbi:MAG: DUF3592 domain-containing protein [Pseudomonadota bacterium]
MKDPVKVVKLVRLVFVSVGLLFFAVGSYMLYDTYEFMQTSQKTIGVVLSVDRIVSRDSNGTSITYSPVFRYEDATGQPFESSPRLRSSSYNFAIGSNVSVRFDPTNPQDVRVDGFFSTWGFGGIFAFMGAFFTIIGFVVPRYFTPSGRVRRAESGDHVSTVRRQ